MIKNDKKGRANAKPMKTISLLSIAIGLIVYRFRKKLKMTQIELARKAGVSQTWVSLIENAAKTGRNINPSPEILEKVAIALEMRGIWVLYRYAVKLRDELQSRDRGKRLLNSA